MTRDDGFGIPEEDRALVIRLVRGLLPNVRIVAFGSRVRSSARKYSDLDVALDAGAPIALSTLSALRERLAECRLAYTVDCIDLRAIDEEFRSHVEATGVPWHGP
jgi:predicted nucleotidyltransferase